MEFKIKFFMVLFIIFLISGIAAAEQVKLMDYEVYSKGKKTGDIKSQKSINIKAGDTIYKESAEIIIRDPESLNAKDLKMVGVFTRKNKDVESFGLDVDDAKEKIKLIGELKFKKNKKLYDIKIELPSKNFEKKFLFKEADFNLIHFDLPVFLYELDETQFDKKYRVLNAFDLEVIEYEFAFKGNKKIEAAGKSFDCRVINVKSKKEEALYYISNESTGPFIVREVGENQDGSYEILLKKLI